MDFKKLAIILLAIIGTHVSAMAQQKVYLEYNNDCMTRMEYQNMNNSNSANLVHYYAQSSNSTRLVLEMRRGEKIRLAGKPNYMLPCSSVKYDENLMHKCNTGLVDYYVVGKDKYGYFASYVKSIGMMKDYGKTFSFNSFLFGFEFEKENLDPTKNMASNKDFNDVMFRGETGLNCLKTYTFRNNTKNTCATYTDLTINPKLGALKITDYENPQFANPGNPVLYNFQLMYINNIPVDNYVGAICDGKKPRDPLLYEPPSAKVIPDEFESRGGAPIVAAKPRPNLSSKTNPNPPKTLPSKPKNSKEEKVRDYPDFSQSVNIGSEYGEPTGPIENYVADCDAYKRPGIHVVSPNETLYSISKMTGISMGKIAKWNKIENRSKIPACSELRLTAPTPDMYDILTEKEKEIAEQAMAEIVKEKETKDKEEKDQLESKGDDKNVNTNPFDELEKHKVHIVKEGETIYTLSKKYGYTAERFMEINDLSSDIITPNMKLVTTDCSCKLPDDYTPKGVDIPKEYDVATKPVKDKKVTHLIKSGDTLYSLSKKYKVSMEKLLAMNDISNPKSLTIGDQLRVK